MGGCCAACNTKGELNMNTPTFDIEALYLDDLKWQLFEDYEPPLNEWVVSRWESSIIEGLYAFSAVYYDGENWYDADGEEVEVTEFAEVEG